MAGTAYEPLIWIPLLPIIGAATVYLYCSQTRHRLSGWIATAFAAASCAMAVMAFRALPAEEGASLVASFGNWFSVGKLNVDFALRLDRLSAVMSLIVTGVGSLIHLYAIGYMEHDEHRPRFFSYLNLFLFAMLLLVLGDNLLMMFVGWEGVGLCSYLLIGFWFKEPANAAAGQKAFVVNRIGDAGFLLGIFTLFAHLGTLAFPELASSASQLPAGTIEFIALMLFIGAMGKSAQVPLYVWLPDAMAGPTPVSALIHAATMVTAGVYMIARMSFLYVHAPIACTVVLCIGTLTALLAATIALTQTDIKKVLAYSTVSQLGFMFMAMGVMAFSNGIYHVVTHAFFKACLFMCAGSVILGCHHEQDMRHFGGLRKYMPLTFITYLLATLAIAGFPYTSGFFSKDAILWTVFSTQGRASEITLAGIRLSHLCWGIGAFTAFLTAFYMTRSLVLTFFGKYRGHGHPHESPWVVTVPLLVLALLSLLYGATQGQTFMEFLHHWTRPDMQGGEEAFAHNHLFHTLEYFSMAIALGGIALAALIYGLKPAIVEGLARSLPSVYRALLNKWYVDEFYEKSLVGPLRGISQLLFSLVDRSIVDATVNGTGTLVEATGEGARRLHTGQIAHYLLWTFGASLFFAVLWFVLG